LIERRDKFDKKYHHLGGLKELKRLCKSREVALTAAGLHFGFTDSALLYWVKILGIKWVRRDS